MRHIPMSVSSIQFEIVLHTQRITLNKTYIVKDKQLPGTGAIRTKVPPSDPKCEMTKIAVSQNTKSTNGRPNERLSPKRWPLRYSPDFLNPGIKHFYFKHFFKYLTRRHFINLMTSNKMRNRSKSCESFCFIQSTF